MAKQQEEKMVDMDARSLAAKVIAGKMSRDEAVHRLAVRWLPKPMQTTSRI